MTALLETRGLTRRFPGVTALDQVDLAAAGGCVHALVGANGAGKSTLMHLLAGTLTPSAGEIRLDRRPVHFASPRAARAAGVAIVYQEPAAIAELTVAEAIYLGHEPRGRLGLIDRRRLASDARALLARYRLPLDPDARVGRMSVAGRQLVEIARALSAAARVVIFDEPTAVLSLAEQENLFAIIRALTAPDRAILYVSHRLEEIFAIADRITVLRDGRRVATLGRGEVTQAELVRLMVGHAVERAAPPPAPPAGAPVLEAALPGGRVFSARAGEIVGLAGLVGSGRSRLARALGGLSPMALTVDGGPARFRSPADALARGIVYLTEDRMREGLFPGLSVLANTSAAALRGLSPGGLVRAGRERRASAAILGRLRVVTRSLRTPVRALSGGNQQKVLFGRALLCRPRVLICDEPTRGVDVGAKEEIYALLRGLSRDGVAIVLISSELEEIAALCHRVLVMRDGAVVRELAGGLLAEHDILMAAMGPAA